MLVKIRNFDKKLRNLRSITVKYPSPRAGCTHSFFSKKGDTIVDKSMHICIYIPKREYETENLGMHAGRNKSICKSLHTLTRQIKPILVEYGYIFTR